METELSCQKLDIKFISLYVFLRYKVFNQKMMKQYQRVGCCDYRKSLLQTSSGVFSILAAVIATLLFLMLIATFAVKSKHNVQIIHIDIEMLPLYTCDDKFLSVALDTGIIASGFKNFNTTDKKLIKMVEHLTPAYFRIGGNLADKLYFSPYLKIPDKSTESFYQKSKYFDKYFDYNRAPNFTMTVETFLIGSQWMSLMNFAKLVNFDVIFDLNSLIRFPNGSWDYSNAETLIRFSNRHNLFLNWELGNEPNSFPHKFNESVNATQMAQDFSTLKKILKKYSLYKNSLLLGPDTTRPQENNMSEIYLKDFLKFGKNVVDIITWHQYYLNGRTAEALNFLDPEIFDLLKDQINVVKNICNSLGIWNKPLWLGETSSAYGGGAPNLSDTFIGSFIWVDKLGLSAKMGIKVVVRQSIFGGYYALLDNNYDPNPDWWVSILYKKLVGKRVVPFYTTLPKKVRLYCHCTKQNFLFGNPPSVTVFGVNMDNSTAKIRIEGLVPSEYEEDLLLTVYAFELAPKDSLFSKNVLLNGKLLKMQDDFSLPVFIPKIINSRPYITMPPFSIVFWVIPSFHIKSCS